MLTKENKIQKSRFENSFAAVSERIGIGVFDERAKKPIKKPGFGFFLFGVILPAFALWFEVSTHSMARILFDPFPTGWHVLLFSFIPLSNLVVFLAVRINLVSFYAITSLMSGFAMGIAILYSLMLATKLPAIGSTLINHSELAFLLIFHPLIYAPLFAVAPLFNAGHVITLLGARQKAFFDGDQLKHFGHIVILIMVLSIEAPSTITRIYLSKALNPENTNDLLYGRYDKSSVNWLRTWGSKEVLLRSCYERSGRATDILGSLYEDQHPVSVDDARRLFYVVTGQAFNEAAIPSSFRSTLKHTGAMQDASGLNTNADDEFDIDTDIAGSTVSGFARGLSTSDSSIQGKVDTDTGVASLDWTCTFENATYVPREARAQVKLPPGACVSGATIWLDGKKKTATIEERSFARNTYVTAVYNHKKDPLLVSMHSPSTVLVQCYPVVRGQITKIELHIVAPLQTTAKNKAQLVLPAFGERNFTFKNKNKVKLDCATKFDIKENLVDFETSKTNLPFQQVNPKPDLLFVVVDGSVKMQPFIKDVSEGLKSIPINNVQIVKVLDGDIKYKNKTDAINALAETNCIGGQDNSEALAAILSQCHQKLNSSSAILWIHEPQPVCQPSDANYISNTIRELKNSNCQKLIYDYQIEPGANKLLEDMDFELSANGIREVPSTGNPKADLERFFSSLQVVKQSAYHEFAPEKNASDDVNILRAYCATMANFSLYGYQNPTLYLCRNYHFVSPVTSFVVVADDDIVAAEEEASKNRKNCEDNISNKMASELFPTFTTAIGPVMESTNAPTSAPKELQCKDQEYTSVRELKEEGAPVLAPAAMETKVSFQSLPASQAPTLRSKQNAMRESETKAGRSLGSCAGGGGAGFSDEGFENDRLAQSRDNKFSCDKAKKTNEAPCITDKREVAPFGSLSNSITSKLDSLSQAASQTSPTASKSSSMDASVDENNQGAKSRKRNSGGFVSPIKLLTFLVVLVFGLIVISIFKSARSRD